MISHLLFMLGSTFKIGIASLSLFDLFTLRIKSISKEFFRKIPISLKLLIAWYIFSSVLKLPYKWDSILYGLRPLQYLLVIGFLYGIRNKKHISIEKLILFLVLTHLLFFLFSDYLYFPFAYNWEVAIFYGFCTLIIPKINSSYWRKLLFLGLTLFMVIYSDQKTVIIALLIISFLNKKRLILASFLFVMLIPFLEGSRLFMFLDSFSLHETLMAISNGFDKVRVYSYEEFVYQQRELLGNSGDLSFHLRLRKWIFASSQMDTFSFIWGLGPGFFGGAADSSYLRIFFETGIVGLFLTIASIRSLNLHRNNLGLFLIITGFFLDTLFSSTVLILLFALWPISLSPAVPDLSAHT